MWSLLLVARLLYVCDPARNIGDTWSKISPYAQKHTIKGFSTSIASGCFPGKAANPLMASISQQTRAVNEYIGMEIKTIGEKLVLLIWNLEKRFCYQQQVALAVYGPSLCLEPILLSGSSGLLTADTEIKFF